MSSTQTITAEEQVKTQEVKQVNVTPELTEEGRSEHKRGAWSSKPASQVVVSAPALSTRSGAQAQKVRFLQQEDEMTKKGKNKEKSQLYPDLGPRDLDMEQQVRTTQPQPAVTTVSHNPSQDRLPDQDVSMMDVQQQIVLTEAEWPSMPPSKNPDASIFSTQQRTVDPAVDTLLTVDVTGATAQPSAPAQEEVDPRELVYDLSKYCPPEHVQPEEQKVHTMYRRHIQEAQTLKNRLHAMAMDFKDRWMTVEEARETTHIFGRLTQLRQGLVELSAKMMTLDKRKAFMANAKDPFGVARTACEGRNIELNEVFDAHYLNSVAGMVERHIPVENTLASTVKRDNWERKDQEVFDLRQGEAIRRSQVQVNTGKPRIITSTPEHQSPDSSITFPGQAMSPIPEEQRSTSTQAEMPQHDVTFINMDASNVSLQERIDQARNLKYRTLDQGRPRPNLSTSLPLPRPNLALRPRGPAPPPPNTPGVMGIRGPRMSVRPQPPVQTVGAGQPPDGSSSSNSDTPEPQNNFGGSHAQDQTSERYDTARQVDFTSPEERVVRGHSPLEQHQTMTQMGPQSPMVQSPSPEMFPENIRPVVTQPGFAGSTHSSAQSVDLAWDYQQYVSFPARQFSDVQAAQYLAQQRATLQQQEEAARRQEERRYYENIINYQPPMRGQQVPQRDADGGGDDPHRGGNQGYPGGQPHGDPAQHGGRGYPAGNGFQGFQNFQGFGGAGGPPGGGPPGGGPPGGGPPGGDPYRGGPGGARDQDSAAMRRLRELEDELRLLREQRERDLAAPPPWVQNMLKQNQDHRRPLKHKLAPLHLMEFSGDHTQWPAYWDLFYALIHKEPNLTDVEKLAYLDSTLTDKSDAKKAIAGFRKIGRSYDAIIMRLKTKYGQKSRLLATLIREILYTSPANDAAQAQAMIDKFWGDTRALESYGVPLTDPCTSIMLISVLQSKMPKKVSEQWEVQLLQDATRKAEQSNLDFTIPDEEACAPFSVDYTVGQFLTFCEERVRAILKTNELAAGNNNILKTQQQKQQQKQSATTSSTGNAASQQKAKTQSNEKSQQAKTATPTAQALVVNQSTPGTSRNARRKARKKAAIDAAGSSDGAQTGSGQKSQNLNLNFHEAGCFACGNAHNPPSCPIQSKMILKEKWDRLRERIKRTPMCVRCFDPGHKADACPKGVCGVNGCTSRHHPIMHDETKVKKDN
jgi:hypothetical protein